MGSPWQSPEAQAPQGHWPTNAGIPPPPPYGPPSGPPAPQRARRWGLGTAVVAVNIVAVAATAAITYALTNHNSSNVTTTPSSATYSDAEQTSAKDKVCQAFDTNQRGSAGQGGFIDRGELNVPVVLRAVNSAVSVRNALTSAASSELTSAVEDYVSTTLDLTSAAPVARNPRWWLAPPTGEYPAARVSWRTDEGYRRDIQLGVHQRMSHGEISQRAADLSVLAEFT